MKIRDIATSCLLRILVGTAFSAGAVEAAVIINEVDADTLGTDTEEFIELYDGGVGNTNLGGLVLVVYNGATDSSYSMAPFGTAIDLDGYSTDNNGYFLLGNTAVTPTPDIIFADGQLQNGADAVALYMANGADFPTGTAITTVNLIDAFVYGTDDSEDLELLDLLNFGQPQVNENANGFKDTESSQRCPNGAGGARNTDTYLQFPPTPAAENGCVIQLPTQLHIDGGYIKLDSNPGFAPVNSDCEVAAHYGRMIVDDQNGLLYICTATGWISK